MTLWMAGLAGFLLILALMAVVADWWESPDRRDARSRNRSRSKYIRREHVNAAATALVIIAITVVLAWALFDQPVAGLFGAAVSGQYLAALRAERMGYRA